MNKYKLIAALIIALTLMLCLAAGAVISLLCFNLLPSPWNHIANGLFCFSMLTWGAYLWINKIEKGNDSPTLTDKLKDE